MGLIRKTLFISTGVVHPNSKKQRSANKSIRAQRETNNYLSQIAQQGQVANSQASSESRPTRKCRDCAELIMLEARKCRFCGLQFSESEVEELIAKQHEFGLSNKEGSNKTQDGPFDEFVAKAQELGKRASKIWNDIRAKQELSSNSTAEAAIVTDETHKQCPHCEQAILKTAQICRHCQKIVQ